MNGLSETQAMLADFPEEERHVAPMYSTRSSGVKTGEIRPHETASLRQEPGSWTRLGPKAAVEYRPAKQEPPQTGSALSHQVQELARLHGVVLGKGSDGTTVRVQFPSPDLTVEFPAELFDVELARYGQVVDYVVKVRPNGFRFQCFELRSAGENPALPELESLLSRIDD